MANAFELKKILEDIIFYAYHGKVPEEKYQQLIRFRVEIDNTVLRSLNGQYLPSERRIRLANLYRNHINLVKTAIHELAHHGDHILNYKGGHGTSFYAVYEILLHTALDMGVLTVEDMTDMVHDSRDHNKVKKILSRYVPHPIDYKKDEKRFVVRNCFSVKEELKANGFRYNSLACTWEKTVLASEEAQTSEFLTAHGCDFEVQDGSSVAIEVKGTLVAHEGSYEHREELKAAGFRWNAEKKRWQKKIDMSSYQEEVSNLAPVMKNVVIKLERNRG